MKSNRTIKALKIAILAAGLGFWFFGASASPAWAKACSTSDECTWPQTCVKGACQQVNTFRLVPECATARSSIPGQAPPVPTLTCMLQTFGRIAQLILGLTGSLALLMFVYGGFLMVTSAGSQEKVSKGKTVMTNAVIGIVIIMTSGLLIQYGMQKIGVSAEFKVIGQTCSDKIVDPNDPTGTKMNVVQGTIVQAPDGTNKCVTSCPNSLLPGFDCIDTKSSSGAGKYCIANLCPGNRDFMCCQITQ